MLQTLLGRDGFRKGMDLYFERHDGQAATVEDFVACFEDATRRDLTQFMTLVLAGRHARARVPARATTSTTQDRRARPSTQVLPPTPGEPQEEAAAHPGELGLLGGNGDGPRAEARDGERLARRRPDRSPKRTRDVPLRRCALAAGAVAAARLLGARQPDDRPRRRAICEFLMANDSDLYNRWQAANSYATRTLVDMRQARCAKGKSPARGVALRQGARRRRLTTSARARLSRPVAVAAERKRPRPRHRQQRRPVAHPPRAWRCASRSARTLGPRSRTSTRRWPRTARSRPTPRSAGQRRCATPR